MEVMGMTRIIAFKGLPDELVAYGEVVAPLLVTNHKAAKDNTVVRLHEQPHVGRIVDILVIFCAHFKQYNEYCGRDPLFTSPSRRKRGTPGRLHSW